VLDLAASLLVLGIGALVRTVVPRASGTPDESTGLA